MDIKKLKPLVGLMEIAQRAGVQRPVVTMWRSRYEDFPEPIEELHIGPVFAWPHVQKWLQNTGRTWDANWSLDQVRRPSATFDPPARKRVATRK